MAGGMKVAALTPRAQVCTLAELALRYFILCCTRESACSSRVGTSAEVGMINDHRQHALRCVDALVFMAEASLKHTKMASSTDDRY